jgi:hypothetical protein
VGSGAISTYTYVGAYVTKRVGRKRKALHVTGELVDFSNHLESVDAISVVAVGAEIRNA